MPFLQDHFSQLRHAIQSLGKRREMFTEGFEVHFTLSESLFHAKARRREESKRVIAGPFAPSRETLPSNPQRHSTRAISRPSERFSSKFGTQP